MAAQRMKRGKRGLYNKRLMPGEAVARREAAFAAIRRLYRRRRTRNTHCAVSRHRSSFTERTGTLGS